MLQNFLNFCPNCYNQKIKMKIFYRKGSYKTNKLTKKKKKTNKINKQNKWLEKKTYNK